MIRSSGMLRQQRVSLKFDTVRSRWFPREKSRDHPFASVSKFWLFRCNAEPAQFSVTFVMRYLFKYHGRISLIFLLTCCYFYQIVSLVSFLHKFLICVFLKFSIVLIFYFSIFGPVTIVLFIQTKRGLFIFFYPISLILLNF